MLSGGQWQRVALARTVRDADAIVVVERGQVGESGDHASLMAAGGTYAKLFRLQAEGYA